MANQYDTTLTANVNAEISWNFQNALDVSTTKDIDRLKLELGLAAGTGNSQIDEMYHDQRVVTASTPNDDLDLVGVLENVFGRTINFSRVHALLIQNTSTTSGDDLLVGAAASNPWVAPFNGDVNAVVKVGPNSQLVLANNVDGFVVTGGSADVLRIAHDGGAADITYNIALIGRKS